MEWCKIYVVGVSRCRVESLGGRGNAALKKKRRGKREKEEIVGMVQKI